ncbi:MAG: PEP-CTERM sorting domain-containing protein [Firmicutes bacterium]|nr:PEP-CTERM sorting domain-containing protein [Bacillota bacterium]
MRSNVFLSPEPSTIGVFLAALTTFFASRKVKRLVPA